MNLMDLSRQIRPAGRGSIRTQLILWNVLALAILLIGLGLVIRFTVARTMITSVDRELEIRIRPAIAAVPPRPYAGRTDLQGGEQGPTDAEGRPLRPPFGPDGEPMPQDGNGPPGGPPGGDFRGGDFRGGDFRGGDGIPEEQRAIMDANPLRPRHFDVQGHVMDRGADVAPWDRGALQQSMQHAEPVFSTRVVDEVPMRVLSRPYPQNPPYQGVVQTVYPLTDIYRAVDGVNRTLLLLIPVALLCAGVGGAYLTDRVLLRVRQLAIAAGRIGDQGMSQRLPVVGDDEFSSLAETFNGVLGRLETAFQRQERLIEQQRRFTADASHELKTPLTIIKGSASLTLAKRGAPEESYRQSLQEIDRAADSMSQLVQDLLMLARADSGRLGQDRIELLVREILTRAVSRTVRNGPEGAPAAPIRLHLADEALSVIGNEQELIRVFINLLNNAIRHTPSDGTITATALQQGGRVLIAVVDTGVGIAPQHLAHLGERFYRVDESRTRADGGSGLGLSICKGILASHNGTMSFASTPGRGTTVTVNLPAAS